MFYVIHPSKNTSLKMTTIKWLKHVGGYAVYNAMNLHITIYALVGFVSHKEKLPQNLR